jgi:Family of unknown function (DUF6232)
MTVFYRSKELVINNEAIVELLSAQRFALTELSRIHIVRKDDDQLKRPASHVAGSALALIAITGLLLDSPAGWAAMALALITIVTAAAAAHLLRRRRWQLLAQHRGMHVCLFSTTDEHTFGQVRRGLVRALEANGR